jgi:hypothetical protein
MLIDLPDTEQRLLILARRGIEVARDALARIEARELAGARQVVEFAVEALDGVRAA